VWEVDQFDDGGFEWAGPGTVFCDNMNLLFMFLSIATSNMVATSLAKRVSFSKLLRGISVFVT
jgi:hypothetical protein